MSETSRAVFLSYASQDAEAAKKICEALRAAGVEVWFDQSELVGGDAWDAKIRKQIKDCALFVPVISASTQARREGYFRIEWRLAAQRTHAIAEGTPFLLPVVIDDTPEPTALVPVEFREVQWTRLSVKDTPESLAVRIERLLGHNDEPLKVEGRRQKAETADRPNPTKRFSAVWLAVVIPVGLTLLLLGAIALKRYRDDGGAKTTAGGRATLAPDPEFPRDPDMRRARDLLLGIESTAEDYALAENLVKVALAARPTDPEAIIVAAFVHNWTYSRFFDTTDERMAAARKYSEWAVQLAPDHPAALAALGHTLGLRGADSSRAVELLQRAVALAPQNPVYHRRLATTTFAVDAARGLEVAREGVRLFPKDALTVYDLALLYRNAGEYLEMEQALDATLALAPIANAIMWKARTRVWLHGDTAALARLLELVPARNRLSSRVVVTRFLQAMSGGGDAAAALQALRAMPGTTLEDFGGTAKGLVTGELLLQMGREPEARIEFEGALAVLGPALAHDPTDVGFRNGEAWAHFRLGDAGTARQKFAQSLATLRRPFRQSLNADWWFTPIPAALLFGDRATALQLIREAVDSKYGRRILRNAFALDPRMKAFREDPEIVALLAEPAGQRTEDGGQRTDKTGSLPADPRSVAVLAFANLSDDKDNEYFSDGISEELLTVLQKIPGLHVAARTSAFSFKGRNATAQEIGQKLGVAHLVEGSVRKAGTNVRISARLSRADTGEQLWSESYTRELKDVFAVQTELAQKIVEQLGSRLGGGPAQAEIQAQVRAAEIGGTRNIEAHELYLQGKFAGNQFTLDDLNRARDLLQRALALDDSFARAWAELSLAGTQLSGYETTRAKVDEAFALADRASSRALALSPDLALAQIARFEFQMFAFDWKGAASSLRRATELAPNDTRVLRGAMNLAYTLGQTEKAAEYGRQATALDPVNPTTLVYYALALSGAGRFAEADSVFRRVVTLSPAAAWSHGGVSLNLSRQGRFDEAAAEAGLSVVDWERLFNQAIARTGQGRKAEAELALRELINRFADVAAFQIAEIYADRRENDHAFEWLDRAYRQRDPGLTWIKVDSFLGKLHGDPRWPAFLRKLGLADEQLK